MERTASVSAVHKISKNHLLCGICHDQYQQPRMLECLHSFCQKCLEKCGKNYYRGDTRLSCPTCRQDTPLPNGVERLKLNFHIISLTNDFKMLQKLADPKSACDICTIDDNVARHRCLDCRINFCKGCLESHRRFPVLSNHKVVTLEDIRLGKETTATNQPARQCEQHQAEIKQFFCLKCEDLFCRDCTVVHEPKSDGHSFADAKTVTLKRRQSLESQCAELGKKKQKLEDSMAAISEVRKKLKINAEKSLANMEAKATAIKADVDKQEEQLKKKIQTFEQERNESLNDREKTIKVQLQSIETSLEIAGDMTNTASDDDFLSLYSEIKANLQNITDTDSPTINIELNVPYKPSTRATDIDLGTCSN